MKNILKFLLVLVPIMAKGQTQSENYIKSVTYKTANTVKITSPSISQAAQSVTYFDGLGRPVQKTDWQQSKSGKDIVTHMEYDIFGRQAEEYLPYKAETSTMAFDASAKIKVLSYYGSPNSALNGSPSQEATGFPFSRKELEDSPISRVLKQASPGNAWRSGEGHEIKMDYQANIAGEVRFFNAATVLNTASGLYDISLTDDGYYAASQLYKTIIYDENTAALPSEASGSTVEFKDKQGRLVLKRAYDAGVKHDTYYVYDIYGNLTYVIPPKAVDLIVTSPVSATQADIVSNAVVTSSGGVLYLAATNSIRLLPGFHAQSGSTFSASIDQNQTVLDNLCYQYKYDNRSRLAEKKLPGKQWEFIIYDKLDRVVATGPADSPFSDLTSKGWIITKYDELGRPVYTGWSTVAAATAAGRITLQSVQNSASVLNESKLTGGTIDGIIVYYSNTVSPTSFKLLTVNYYDNYASPSTPAILVPLSVEGQTVLTTMQIKGLASGTWTRVATTSTAVLAETTGVFYDYKGRPVRNYKANHLGGYSYTDSKLDFSGKVQYSITRHKRLSSSTEITVRDAFTYSAQDRLMTQTHQINGGTVELIASNTYDELGHLISKKVGNTEAAPVQNIHYTYNIRGWLTAINDINSLAKSGDPKDLFAFKINYNSPETAISGVASLYNGNISETMWAANFDNGIVRAYGYKYDNLNRLKEGIFKKASVLSNAYNETLSYDKNGNIMSLVRNGSSETAVQIDNLVYSYGSTNAGNQLTKVSDNAPASSKAEGFADSASNASDDYSYDANGNLIQDNNKNITAVSYNHMNLPTRITFGSAGNIVYIYNTAGQKVQKVVTTASPPNVATTDYQGGFQYKTDCQSCGASLRFFPTAEGYVEVSGSTYKYIYQYKDHLGNIRVSYDKSLVIQEENNYYPFGLKHMGYNGAVVSTNDALKYNYNGKELQDENIGGWKLNMYDYGARNYDPAIARWMNIDPLAEITLQPYSYANNNPILFLDPTGMIGESTHTDRFGNVVAVYDDNDLGVYKHKGNAKETKKELGDKYSRKNTSGGGKRMGRTLTPFSFTNEGDFSKPVGNIDFDSNWNEVSIQAGMNESNGIVDYALHAGNNQPWDLKSQVPGTEYSGSIIFDDKNEKVYGSRRDAGNFLAGAKAQRSILPTKLLLYGFGAYNASGNSKGETLQTMYMDYLSGGNILTAPYYGEDRISGAAILQGVQHYKNFSNNWIFPEKPKIRK